MHSESFPTSYISFKLCFSLSLFPFPHPAQQDRIAPAPCSWQRGTLHYAAAHSCTSVLSGVVLHSVGCKHENVLFLFMHRFEPCSVASSFCSFRSETVAHPLSVIKIWTNLTQGSKVTHPALSALSSEKPDLQWKRGVVTPYFLLSSWVPTPNAPALREVKGYGKSGLWGNQSCRRSFSGDD